MGQLTATTGVKKEARLRFVLVPFFSTGRRGEGRDFRDGKDTNRTNFLDLADDITTPEKSVLDVLAHSGRGVSEISGDADEKLTANELVDRLVESGLPPKSLAIKSWACFSGVNDFAMQERARFTEIKRGYNPTVVGCNEVTGAHSTRLTRRTSMCFKRDRILPVAL
ncbi:MAG: hypothetical protein ABIQ36_13970 [Rhodanobacter sp.]